MKLELITWKIDIQPEFIIFLSLGLLVIPVPWLLSWILAGVIHELFHFVALRLCEYPVKNIKIGFSGARLETEMEPGFKMALCAIAGPVSGFLLLAAVHIIPRIAICGLLQSAWNLLPVYPLDGSRVIIGLLSVVYDEKTVKTICLYLERSVILLIWIIACYATFQMHLGIMPILLAFVLFIRKKLLANHQAWRYNIGNRR